MAITAAEVKKVAHLARLHVNEAETQIHVTNLSNILGLIAEMQAINTDGVKPMAHPEDNAKQKLREDKVTEKDQRTLFQSIAPEVAEGLYLVPKVIE